MVKKHLPPLEELLNTLKKRIQDHKVMPFHRIEEMQETLNKIVLIAKQSGPILVDQDEEQKLVLEAQNIIEEFHKIKE